MRWLGEIHKVLGIAAPVLVLLSVLKHALSTGRHLGPLAVEWLLDGLGQLHQVDLLRGEDAEEVVAVVRLFNVFDLNVWYDYIVNVLLVMDWTQRKRLRQLAVLEAVCSLRSLENNVVLLDLPKAIALGFNANYHEVDVGVGLVLDGLVLLHETDDDCGILVHSQSVLWVVEPFFVGISFNH